MTPELEKLVDRLREPWEQTQSRRVAEEMEAADAITRLTRESDEARAQIERMAGALESALNFIQNTESEIGVILGCGDVVRAALKGGAA